MIACVLIPHFAAAVERRDAPSLGMAPLVIERSGKVLAVSEDAVRAGIQPGMRTRRGRALCPKARFILADPDRYRRTFETLLKTLESFTPRLEPGDMLPSATSWLDLGRLEEGRVIETVQHMGRSVRQTMDLAAAIGLAEAKFPAQVAAGSVTPNRALVVPRGGERRFLAPFPLDLLPLEPEMARQLRLLGIHTLGQLADLPASAILTQFGSQGQVVHRLAQGQQDEAVLPRRPARMESVSRQPDGPVADRMMLEAMLADMAVELAERLQARGLMGRDLKLALGLEDGITHEERLVMRQPGSDSRHLTRVLGELATRTQPGCAVTELEVTMTDLIQTTGQQLDLFVHQTSQAHRLREALEDLAARHGPDCFFQFSLLGRTIPLPERRFRLRQVDMS